MHYRAEVAGIKGLIEGKTARDAIERSGWKVRSMVYSNPQYAGTLDDGRKFRVHSTPEEKRHSFENVIECVDWKYKRDFNGRWHEAS